MKLDEKKVKKVVTFIIIGSLILVPIILLDRVFPFLFVNSIRNTIEINSDADFAKYEFPGNGSKENPIVIADLVIGTDNYRIRRAYTLVDISNTSYHIIIENCCFNGGPYTIEISRLRGGSITIRNNSFIGHEQYIGLDGYFNTLFIEILDASNVYILDNDFEGSSWGYLFISEVSNLIVYNNRFASAGENNEMMLDNCQNITLDNNLIKGDIRVFYSDSFNFTYNEIYSDFSSLIMQGGNNSLVFGNNFINCTYYAIILNDETMFVEIFHNSFLDNNIGGLSQAKDLGSNNTWFNLLLLEGNFWSDLGSNSTYEIDGSAGSVDLYPLSSSI